MGNLTYGAGVSADKISKPGWLFILTLESQIILHSTEKQSIMTNLPWLIGSLGTIAEDALIFVQFHMYGERQSAIED